MCGIVGFSGCQKAAPILLTALSKLEYRGYDSAGIALNGNGRIDLCKTTGMIRNLSEKTKNGEALAGHSGVAHTRWATHGAPNEVNAHPHISQDGKFAIVHNGIIENYAELREELIDIGVKFVSETDSEVAAQLIGAYYEGDVRHAVLKAAGRLKGSYALGIVCADTPGVVYALREESPLIIGLGVDENYFASDITAFISYTRSVKYLNDGEFAEISADEVHIFDETGRTVERGVTRITWDVEAAEKGGFEHFMLKEIMEQPRAVKSTIDARIKDGAIALEDIKLTAEDLKGVREIVLVACGSAYHAGCVGKYAIEDLCNIPVRVEIASELRYRAVGIGPDVLAIAISQSGETADTLAAMRELKARGARVLAIVNVVGSAVAKLADDVIYTWAGPEIAVATTKGYTTQVSTLYLLAIYFGALTGRIDAARQAYLIKELQKVPPMIKRAIDLNHHAEYLAKRYAKNDSVFYIGRNIDCAVCLEGSLKLKEISYVHSEAYAAGELKHGTIALIEQDRLVVALACYAPLFDKMMNNIKEVKARGAKVLGVTPEGNKRIFAEADDALFVPIIDPVFMPVVEIVPLQLFAYYVAYANGCDIDKPKNLAKSVTVE